MDIHKILDARPLSFSHLPTHSFLCTPPGAASHLFPFPISSTSLKEHLLLILFALLLSFWEAHALLILGSGHDKLSHPYHLELEWILMAELMRRHHDEGAQDPLLLGHLVCMCKLGERLCLRGLQARWPRWGGTSTPHG